MQSYFGGTDFMHDSTWYNYISIRWNTSYNYIGGTLFYTYVLEVHCSIRMCWRHTVLYVRMCWRHTVLYICVGSTLFYTYVLEAHCSIHMCWRYTVLYVCVGGTLFYTYVLEAHCSTHMCWRHTVLYVCVGGTLFYTYVFLAELVCPDLFLTGSAKMFQISDWIIMQ